MKRITPALLVAAIIAAMISYSAAWAVEPGYFQDQKVVYHNNGGGSDNATYFKKMLNNMKNHVETVGKDRVEIRVVDHGAGVDLFSMALSDKDLAGRLDWLRGQEVRFLICEKTLTERKIDWRTLYGVTEADIVPSGAAELARLQAMGFVYIHM